MQMMRSAWIATLLLFAPLLLAQSLPFGEPFQLTNTRYGTVIASPVVKSNGRDFFLFWQTDTNLRVTKIVEGEHRAGRHVVAGASNAAVTWTGTHFFVANPVNDGMIGLLLDANAEPAGGTFRIADAPAEIPAVASNGRTVLVLYSDSSAIQAVALRDNGVHTGIRSTVIPPGGGAISFDVASNGDGFAAVVSTQSGVVALTYDGDGRELSRELAYTGVYPATAGNVAIGSDGGGYLAAWQIRTGAAEAARVRADGSIGPAVTLEPAGPDRSFAGPIRVAWTGANWAVAYTTDQFGGGDRRLRVAYVHPSLAQVVGREDPGAGMDPAIGVANGRTLMAWRPDLLGAPTVASLLPLAGHEPEPVTFAAGGQKPLAVASTVDATLVVWIEVLNGESTLRAGVRSAGGDWVEREIASGGTYQALAASDGRDFVVVARGNTGTFAYFLDVTSRVTAGPIALPIWPGAIAWTGTDYLVANTFSIVRLGRSGSVSAPVGQSHAVAAIGSNGTDVMAVLFEPEPCPILCPGAYGRPRFARLGADLRPTGEPRLIAPGRDSVIDSGAVVWDGNRFLAAWMADGKVNVAELPLDGAPARVVAAVDTNSWSGLHMAAVQGGVAVTWREPTIEGGLTHTRLVRVSHNNRIYSSVPFHDGAHQNTAPPFVAALPNGRIGHMTAVAQFAPPHHGSRRLIMRVSGAALPPEPDPPRLRGEVRNGRIELAWTAPPQEIAGYRLEYRIGDGSWNEFDRWFDANDNEVRVPWQLRKGVAYQFRIRAFSDAGTSGYSAPVILNRPKRRSVR